VREREKEYRTLASRSEEKLEATRAEFGRE
jgi:hypothetical protein